MEALITFLCVMCVWPFIWFIAGYAIGRNRIRIRIERLD